MGATNTYVGRIKSVSGEGRALIMWPGLDSRGTTSAYQAKDGAEISALHDAAMKKQNLSVEADRNGKLVRVSVEED